MFRYITDARMRVPLVVLGVLLILAAIFFFPGLLRMYTAEIIYVRPVATGAGNGTSWDNATTLQDALQHRARARDEVWIAAGTHYPVTPVDLAAVAEEERAISFVVRSGVALYGGFAGMETARDQRDPITHLTVLSGDIDQNGELDAGNSWTVVNLSGTDATTVLDGLKITGGNADGDAISGPIRPYNFGGGVLNIGGSATLTNVQIVNNAAERGGGVYIDEDDGRRSTASRPTFTNVTINDNAGLDGVFIAGASSPTFTNVTINNNGANGVGIWDASSPTFTDVTISNNGFGGRVINAGEGVIIRNVGRPVFTNVTISANRGTGVRISGPRQEELIDANFHGASIEHPSSPIFASGTISDNGDVGVYIEGESSPSFTDVSISANASHGMHIEDESTPTCTNVIIKDNRGEHVYSEGSLTPTTCTE